MARDTVAQDVAALHRFALAPRPGLLASIRDVRAALIAELDGAGAGRIRNDNLQSSGEAARAAFNFRQERKAARTAARSQDGAEKPEAKDDAAEKPAPAMNQQGDPPKPKPGPPVPQQIYLAEAKAWR